jgi:hypothetical protein
MATTTNPDRPMSKPPRRRRWIPLSLRAFIVILAKTTAWTGFRVYRQVETIWGIRRVGGAIHIDTLFGASLAV